MRMPLPSFEDDSPQADNTVAPSKAANPATPSAGVPQTIQGLHMRFNPRLVGFGIIGPSTHAPKVKENLTRNVYAAETPSGKNLEDRK